MPIETNLEITCPSCKTILRINRIDIRVAEVPSEPDPDGTVHCPRCKEPSFRIVTRKVEP